MPENPYQSPCHDESLPGLVQDECDLGLLIGGLGGIAGGLLLASATGGAHDGLELFLYGDWGYLAGSVTGGAVGAALMARRWWSSRLNDATPAQELAHLGAP